MIEITTDEKGNRYGRYVIISEFETKKPGRHVLCLCDCGTEKVVRLSQLKSGNTKSCGCYKHDQIIRSKYIHGHSGTKLYIVWVGMRQRCGNPKNKRFPLYGGRGIKVCEEWSNYEAFYGWAVANGYHEGLSIDRVENNGNYEPDNCRWVKQRVQTNNQRTNKMITYRGRTQSLSCWAEELGVNYKTLRSRLRIGWSPEKAFETPMEGRGYDRVQALCQRQRC